MLWQQQQQQECRTQAADAADSAALWQFAEALTLTYCGRMAAVASAPPPWAVRLLLRRAECAALCAFAVAPWGALCVWLYQRGPYVHVCCMCCMPMCLRGVLHGSQTLAPITHMHTAWDSFLEEAGAAACELR